MTDSITYYESDAHLAHRVRATRLEHATGMHGDMDPVLCRTCHAAWNDWNYRFVRRTPYMTRARRAVWAGGCVSLLMWSVAIILVLALVAV